MLGRSIQFPHPDQWQLRTHLSVSLRSARSTCPSTILMAARLLIGRCKALRPPVAPHRIAVQAARCLSSTGTRLAPGGRPSTRKSSGAALSAFEVGAEATKQRPTQELVRQLRAACNAALAGERSVPQWSISVPNAGADHFKQAPVAVAVLDIVEQYMLQQPGRTPDVQAVASALELAAMDPGVGRVLREDTRAGTLFQHMTDVLAAGQPMALADLATCIRALSSLQAAMGQDAVALSVSLSSLDGVVQEYDVETSFSYMLARLGSLSAASAAQALGKGAASPGSLAPVDVWTIIVNGRKVLPLSNLRALLTAMRPALPALTWALAQANQEVSGSIMTNCSRWRLDGPRGIRTLLKRQDAAGRTAAALLQQHSILSRWALDVVEIIALSKMGYRLVSTVSPLTSALVASLHAATASDLWWRMLRTFPQLPGFHRGVSSNALQLVLDRADMLTALPRPLPALPAADQEADSKPAAAFLPNMMVLDVPSLSQEVVNVQGEAHAAHGGLLPAAHPLQSTSITPAGAAEVAAALAQYPHGSLRSRWKCLLQLANHVYVNRHVAGLPTLLSMLHSLSKVSEGTLSHPVPLLALMDAVAEALLATTPATSTLTPRQVSTALQAQAHTHTVHSGMTQWCHEYLLAHIQEYSVLDIATVVNSAVKLSLPLPEPVQVAVVARMAEHMHGILQGHGQQFADRSKGSTLRQTYVADSTEHSAEHMFRAHAIVSFLTGALPLLQAGEAGNELGPAAADFLDMVPSALRVLHGCLPPDIHSEIRRRLPALEEVAWHAGTALPMASPEDRVQEASGSRSATPSSAVDTAATIMRPGVPMRTVLQHLPLRQVVISPRDWLLLLSLRTHLLRLVATGPPRVADAARAAVQALPAYMWQTAELVSSAWVAGSTHIVPADLHTELQAAYATAAATGDAPPVAGWDAEEVQAAAKAGAALLEEAEGQGDVDVIQEGPLAGISRQELDVYAAGGEASDALAAALRQPGAGEALAAAAEEEEEEPDLEPQQWAQEQLLRDLPDEVPMRGVGRGVLVQPHHSTPQHLSAMVGVLEAAEGIPPFQVHTLVNGIRADVVFPTKRLAVEVYTPFSHDAATRWEDIHGLPQVLAALRQCPEWLPANQYYVTLLRQFSAADSSAEQKDPAGLHDLPSVAGVPPSVVRTLWDAPSQLTETAEGGGRGGVWRTNAPRRPGMISQRRREALEWMGWTVLSIPATELSTPGQPLPQALVAALQ